MNEQYQYKKVFKWFHSFEKEEKWLDEMSMQGWNLFQVNQFGRYTFVCGVPEKRKYRIDYRYFKQEIDFDEYVALFWDSGWNLISGGKGCGNQYFYSANLDESCEIFSDERSRAGRYKRAAWHTLWITILMCVPYISMWQTGAWNFSLSAYQKYQIAELSNETGFASLSTFLHLAVPLFLQALFCICAAIMLALCIFYAIKAKRCYNKAMKDAM